MSTKYTTITVVLVLYYNNYYTTTLKLLISSSVVTWPVSLLISLIVLVCLSLSRHSVFSPSFLHIYYAYIRKFTTISEISDATKIHFFCVVFINIMKLLVAARG